MCYVCPLLCINQDGVRFVLPFHSMSLGLGFCILYHTVKMGGQSRRVVLYKWDPLPMTHTFKLTPNKQTDIVTYWAPDGATVLGLVPRYVIIGDKHLSRDL